MRICKFNIKKVEDKVTKKGRPHLSQKKHIKDKNNR
jgi:hypothetical protein